jgi:zinc D-Ala-D-Ala carboxypeptidase
MRPNNPQSAGRFQRLFLFVLILLAGCNTTAPGAEATPSPVPPVATATATALPAKVLTDTLTAAPPTSIPVPTATPFPLPTAGPIVSCSERKPASDDLCVIVTTAFGLSEHYVPPDLVRLDKYLPYTVVYSDQVRVRRPVVEPLVKMIKAMQAAGLKPIVRSGYRSYYDQATARAKWEQQYPDRADLVSALPGHSEHQLGLAVDFGSPELAEIVGDPTIEYHTDFDKTSEGLWLAEHAYEYGFTLSYPVDAMVWTGLVYEPWHFRYVGVDLSTYLHDTGQFLTQYLMQVRAALPCMPGER